MKKSLLFRLSCFYEDCKAKWNDYAEERAREKHWAKEQLLKHKHICTALTNEVALLTRKVAELDDCVVGLSSKLERLETKFAARAFGEIARPYLDSKLDITLNPR